MSIDKIAIDFDSSYTTIYKLGSGVVLSEPTVAAVSADSKNQIKAVGYEARKLIGKTAENTKIVFPVFEGEIVNEKVATKLITAFLRKIDVKSSIFGVSAVVSVPCGAEPQTYAKYKNVLKGAGVSKISFVEAPILSAIGQRIPMTDSSPCFLIDMAGGTTNIAAVTLDGVIAGVSVNFGNNKIVTDIIDYIAEVHGLQVGILTAERIKKEIGSAFVSSEVREFEVKGRNLAEGVPRSFTISSNEVLEALTEPLNQVVGAVKKALEQTPPELGADIAVRGLMLTGGGALLKDLDRLLMEETGLPVVVADDPLSCVVRGCGIALEGIGKIEDSIFCFG